MAIAAPSAQVRIATLLTAGWAELTLLHAGVLSTKALAVWLGAPRSRRTRCHPGSQRDGGARAPGRGGGGDGGRAARLPLQRRVRTRRGGWASGARGHLGDRGQRAGPGHRPRPVRRARAHLRGPRLRRRRRGRCGGRRAPHRGRRPRRGLPRAARHRSTHRGAPPPGACRASPRALAARGARPPRPSLWERSCSSSCRIPQGFGRRASSARLCVRPSAAHRAAAPQRCRGRPPGTSGASTSTCAVGCRTPRSRASPPTPRPCGGTRCSPAMTAPPGTRRHPTSATSPPEHPGPGRSRPSPARSAVRPPARTRCAQRSRPRPWCSAPVSRPRSASAPARPGRPKGRTSCRRAAAASPMPSRPTAMTRCSCRRASPSLARQETSPTRSGPAFRCPSPTGSSSSGSHWPPERRTGPRSCPGSRAICGRTRSTGSTPPSRRRAGRRRRLPLRLPRGLLRALRRRRDRAAALGRASPRAWSRDMGTGSRRRTDVGCSGRPTPMPGWRSMPRGSAGRPRTPRPVPY